MYGGAAMMPLMLGLGVPLIAFAGGDPSARSSAPAPGSVGIFEGQQDIGTVLHAGSAEFDAAKGTSTLNGSAANMWLTKDAFHFAWKKASGDLSMEADIAFV